MKRIYFAGYNALKYLRVFDGVYMSNLGIGLQHNILSLKNAHIFALNAVEAYNQALQIELEDMCNPELFPQVGKYENGIITYISKSGKEYKIGEDKEMSKLKTTTYYYLEYPEDSSIAEKLDTIKKYT